MYDVCARLLFVIRENVARLEQQACSLVDAIAVKPIAASDAEWGRTIITPAFLTQASGALPRFFNRRHELRSLRYRQRRFSKGTSGVCF
jgi:hypothetical protein